MRRINRIEVLLSLLLPLVAAFAIYAQPSSKPDPAWNLEITVPPQPTTPNSITFSGGGAVKKDDEKSKVDKWREDLRYLAAELPIRHKNLYRHRPRRLRVFLNEAASRNTA